MPRLSIHPQLVRPQRRGARSAFTLIELLVVIGILIIIAGTVIVAFDNAGTTAGDDLTRQRMAATREALLRFRGDMGYFPGEGPLAPANLDLSGFDYVDGENPAVEDPAAAVRQAWARHAMNLWQLLEKPIDATDAARWNWDRDTKRGWNGPYLNAGYSFRLDRAGNGSGFIAGSRYNRLFAVADAFERKREINAPYLRWIVEREAPPAKEPLSKHGQPLFLERTPASGLPALFTLVSMGRDGQADLVGDPNPDDLRLEVAREK